jgi:hypothetical protein
LFSRTGKVISGGLDTGKRFSKIFYKLIDGAVKFTQIIVTVKENFRCFDLEITSTQFIEIGK